MLYTRPSCDEVLKSRLFSLCYILLFLFLKFYIKNNALHSLFIANGIILGPTVSNFVCALFYTVKPGIPQHNIVRSSIAQLLATLYIGPSLGLLVVSIVYLELQLRELFVNLRAHSSFIMMVTWREGEGPRGLYHNGSRGCDVCQCRVQIQVRTTIKEL